MSKYTAVHIARMAHQVNKAYCELLGDVSQVDWEHAPEWQKDSAIMGVEFHQSHPGVMPDAMHNGWMAQKTADGWVLGPIKDTEKKEHPCMVPFEQLPAEQQLKDSLFSTVCSLLGQIN